MQGVKNCKILEWLSNTGMEISKQQLHKIFVNPFYAGKISHKALGGAVIDGNQPPLITWSEFERVQLALSAAGLYGKSGLVPTAYTIAAHKYGGIRAGIILVIQKETVSTICLIFCLCRDCGIF